MPPSAPRIQYPCDESELGCEGGFWLARHWPGGSRCSATGPAWCKGSRRNIPHGTAVRGAGIEKDCKRLVWFGVSNPAMTRRQPTPEPKSPTAAALSCDWKPSGVDMIEPFKPFITK